MTRWLAAAVFAVAAILAVGTSDPAAAGQGSAATGEDDAVAHTEVVIVTAGGKHRFQVEVARTPSQRRKGLMFRRRLAPDSGMLFLFDRPQLVSMWMKNTYVPLDMLFIDVDGQIVNIARNTTPLSLEPIRSAGPVAAVLEVVAGTTEKLGIEAGDRVDHPALHAGQGGRNSSDMARSSER